MASDKVVAALNEDLSAEIAATIQYLWHHYMAEGMESPAIVEEFEKASTDEMRHIEKLAQRIVYLRGTPTTKPAPIKTGGGLKQMVRDDLKAENEAIARYKRHIQLCADEADPTSRLMLEKILTDEEKHADTWETILGARTPSGRRAPRTARRKGA